MRLLKTTAKKRRTPHLLMNSVKTTSFWGFFVCFFLCNQPTLVTGDQYPSLQAARTAGACSVCSALLITEPSISADAHIVTVQ